jgi:type I restriction enzyme, R subunit
MRSILASRAWSAPQKGWLNRIGEQIEKSVVIDRETIDTNEPFASDGGFKRLNRVFDGELENIIAGINEEIWKRTA